MHSVLDGTASSHPSSWDDSSLLFSEYQEPAWEASRLAMSMYLVFNLFTNDARSIILVVEKEIYLRSKLGKVES